MDDFAFESAYERLCKSLDVSTQVQLAAKLSISQPSISNASKRKTLPEAWLTTAQTKYNVCPLWVKAGTGAMGHTRGALSTFPAQEDTVCGTLEKTLGAVGHTSEALDTYPVQEDTVCDTLKEAPLVYESATPVYSCQCEYVEQKPFPKLHVLHRTSLPPNCVKEGICVLYYELTAFEPQIKKNAYVGIDTTQTRILSGEVYAIFTPLEGLALKRIFPAPNQSGYILQVDSATHRDTYMSAKQLSARIFGRMTWTLNYV